MTEDTIRLTQYSHGGGCGCKIAPKVLSEILKHGQSMQNDNLIVGNSTNDDAAVYALNETEGLVATTDFFTPIVDDPYVFGKVAAANAVSDVYAMGGKPILALAILGWPIGKLSESVANRVMQGARNICNEAGIPLAGGHSIDTPEPVFGLAVNGLVKLNHLKQNNTAQAGDVILLTKPLGVGILSTATKKGLVKEEDLKTLYSQLTQVNSVGYELGKIEGVHAMTDVTGFGLLGHLTEMAEGSDLSAEIDYSKVPKLKCLPEYLAQKAIPGATPRNLSAYREKIAVHNSIDEAESFHILPDPQTNGGLLIAVSPDSLEIVQQLLSSHGYPKEILEPIGFFKSKANKVLEFT